MKPSLLATAMFAFAFQSHGGFVSAAEGAPEKCHEIGAPSARLEYYDDATGYGTAAKPAVPEVSEKPRKISSGKQWRKKVENSALDGRKIVWLSVGSKNS